MSTKGILYVMQNNVEYAIPQQVAEKYIVTQKKRAHDNVSAEEVFGELNEKYTKAGALLKGLRYREDLTQVMFAKKLSITQANLS